MKPNKNIFFLFFYNLMFIWCMGTSQDSIAVESSRSIALQESSVKSRYQMLEARFNHLKAQGRDLNHLKPLLKRVERLKKNKDLKAMDAVLTEFEMQLKKVESPNSAYHSETPSTEIKVLDATPSLIENDSNSGISEQAALLALKSSKGMKLLHAQKRQSIYIGSKGQVGRNRKKFSDVAAQRDALWILRDGLLLENNSSVHNATQAFVYAFSHQNSDGSFKNGLGYDQVTAVGADAFFLYSVANAYLLLVNQSSHIQSFRILDGYKNHIRLSAAWLKKNQNELLRQDARTPNRLLFNALAFYFSGRILHDQDLLVIGESWLKKALLLQNVQGAFLEKGGTDTSYHAVCILNLSLLYFYAADEKLKAMVSESISRATPWLTERIDANGKVSVVGNTRTGLGQEIQSGKSKDVNYAEVALALYYAAVILNRPEWLSVADGVVQYAVSKANR